MSQPQPTESWALFVADICEKTARKPRKPKTPKPVSANELTRQIVQYLRDQGAFATRLQSTGAFRADLQKFVPNTQISGLCDVLACFEGRFIGVEIKVGRDSLSEVQKRTIAQLQSAGAVIYVAHDFESFRKWFTAEFLTPPFA